MPRGDALPGGFGRVARFPNQTAALVEALQRVGVREGFRIAAQHHIDVIQLAVDADAFRRHHQIIIGRRAFFLGAIFRIGHDEELLHQPALVVVLGVLPRDQIAKFPHNRAEVFPCRNHAPAADGMKTHRNGLLRQQGGRVL